MSRLVALLGITIVFGMLPAWGFIQQSKCFMLFSQAYSSDVGSRNSQHFRPTSCRTTIQENRKRNLQGFLSVTKFRPWHISPMAVGKNMKAEGAEQMENRRAKLQRVLRAVDAEVKKCMKEAHHSEARAKKHNQMAERDATRLNAVKTAARELRQAIAVLDSSTQSQATIPALNFSSGAIIRAKETLGSPCFMAIDTEGQIIVSDFVSDQLVIFNGDGDVVRRFQASDAATGQPIYPRGVAVDQQGRIFVADAKNHRIQVLNADGSVASCFGSEGTAVGQLYSPSGLVMDANGDLVVAECLNHRIQIFRTDGTVVRHFGSRGSAVGQFELPHSVAVDGAGRIVVTDRARVQVFNPDGTVALCIAGGTGMQPGQLQRPWAVAVDRKGRFVIADADRYIHSGRLQIFDSDGKFKRMVEGLRVLPNCLALDGAGRILVGGRLLSQENQEEGACLQLL